MHIETDIKRIEALAAQKEDENWSFRSFLKGSRLSTKRIDAAVHELYRTISDQIDCTRCANCCKAALPALEPEDVQRLATHLGITEDDLVAHYLEEDDDGLTFGASPCPFLKDNLS